MEGSDRRCQVEGSDRRWRGANTGFTLLHWPRNSQSALHPSRGTLAGPGPWAPLLLGHDRLCQAVSDPSLGHSRKKSDCRWHGGAQTRAFTGGGER